MMSLANGADRSHNGGVEEGVLPNLTLTEETLAEVWREFQFQLLAKSPILAGHLKSTLLPAIFGPNSLVIRFPSSYNHAYEACATEFNVQKLQDVLKKLTGRPAVVRVELVTGPVPAAARPNLPPPPPAAADRKKQLLGLPIFKKAAESLGAQIWHVDDEFNPNAAPPKPAAPTDPDPDEV